MRLHDPSCPEPDCRCYPLSKAVVGQRMVVRHLEGDSGLCQRLREMGLMEEGEVELVRSGSTVIARVADSRLCLSKSVAKAVLVAPRSAEASAQEGDNERGMDGKSAL